MRGGGCSAIYGQWCELEGEKRSNAVINFIIVNFFLLLPCRSLYDNNIPTLLNGTFESLWNIQTL